MRTHLLPLIPLLFLTACREETLTLHGTLLPGSDATDVYVVGQPLRGRVVADSFSITGITGETVDLEFVDGDERLGRMRLEGWRSPTLSLRGIWTHDGVAYATGLAGDEAAAVNGLRLGGPAALPREVRTDGVVLAVARGGDAMIVRPTDGRLPDLRVVVTPGTAVQDEAGTGVEADLQFGDSLRVEGTAEAGYVVATRLLVRPQPGSEGGDDSGSGEVEDRERAGAGDGGREREGDRPPEAEEERRGPRSLVRPGAGRGRGRGLQRRDQ